MENSSYQYQEIKIFLILMQVDMIDEDIIAAAKRIILKNSKKEESCLSVAKSDARYQSEIDHLLDKLLRVEQKLDILLASK